MAKRPKTTKNTAGTETKKTARRSFRLQKRQSTSIYFLLWTFFSAVALVAVLLFGFSQRALLKSTYKDEAASEVATKGSQIHEAILKGPPAAFGNNNYNGY